MKEFKYELIDRITINKLNQDLVNKILVIPRFWLSINLCGVC